MAAPVLHQLEWSIDLSSAVLQEKVGQRKRYFVVYCCCSQFEKIGKESKCDKQSNGALNSEWRTF